MNKYILSLLIFITSWGSLQGQNVKISDMTTASDLSGTVYIPIVQGGLNKKWSINSLPLPVTAGGTGINSFGTGVATALGINVGSAGAFTTFNGAGGTPSSMTGTNITGIPESGVTNLTTDLAAKQATLVSGTNIKTVNGTSLLGSGDVGTIDAAHGGTGITSLGSGVSTWLGTPTATNLASALGSQTANTVYAAPNGSSGNASFRSLVNTDLPNGTQVLLPEVGNIISESWPNLTNWTKVGSQTFTVSGGNLSVVGGSPGSINLSNYYKQTAYGTASGSTMYGNWTASFNITVGTLSSSSYGVAFGLQSSGAYFSASQQIGIMLDNTNKGKIFKFTNNSNTIIDQSAGAALSITAGDVLAVTITREYHGMFVTVTNTSLSPKKSISLLTTCVANTSNFAIYAMGGTHTVGALNIVVHQKVGNTLLACGDSRTMSGSTVNHNHQWPTLVSEQLVNGFCDIYGAPGNGSPDYIASEILALAPKYIVFLSGTNDKGLGGLSDATVATNYNTLFGSLTGYTLGTNLFYCDELPRVDFDMAGCSNQMKTTIGTTGVIYTYQTFLGSGTAPITTRFASDGLHLNIYGHQELASTIVNQLIGIIPLKSRMRNQNIPVYINNGKVNITNDANVTTTLLDIYDNTGNSPIHISGTGNDDGVYIGPSDAGSTNLCRIGAGVQRTGGNNIAKATAGAEYTFGGATPTHLFKIFTGATIGAGPTLSTIVQIGANGIYSGGAVASTAKFHAAAGSTAASSAPLKFTTGTSMTSAEAGAFEFTTDDLFFTITTGTARKRFLFADATGGLTSGRVPVATTNGRLLDYSAFTHDGTRLSPQFVTLAAGTTSNAPLLLTSGTNLTSVTSGAVEFDGTNYFGSASTTRYTFAKTLTNTATLDFGSTLAGAATDLTITVTGAADGDPVSIGVPNGSTLSDGNFTAWVSAANTVTVRFANNSLTLTLDPASGTFRATVIKY